MLMLFQDFSFLEHVADDRPVIGTVETVCVHPWILGQPELALPRDATIAGCTCKYVWTQFGLGQTRWDNVIGHPSFINPMGFEVPVSFFAVGIVQLIASWIGSSDTFATHDVAGTCALVEITVGLLRVERQSARF